MTISPLPSFHAPRRAAAERPLMAGGGGSRRVDIEPIDSRQVIKSSDCHGHVYPRRVVQVACPLHAKTLAL